MALAGCLIPPHFRTMSSVGRLPRVVIVGRPNVGKSSLFNRIIGRRLAVIEHQPGVTRDRLYHVAEWSGINFELVDTGGILFGEDDPLVEQIRVQAQIALEEADVVLFMVDAVDGPMPADYDLADKIRGLRCPVLVVANKADNEDRETWTTEFYGLGLGDVHPISALHGRGTAELLDEVVRRLPTVNVLPTEEETTRIAIVGRPNVGKSSLTNALLGEERMIVSDLPGTTRDAIDSRIAFRGETITLVDTAGIRRRGKVQGSIEYYMVLRAERALERADVALVVVDGAEGLTDGDKRIAKQAHEHGKAAVFAVNKWDIVEPPDGRPNKRSKVKTEFAKSVRDDFPELTYAPLAFVSAFKRTGLEALLETCMEVSENHHFRVATGRLNGIIREAMFARPLTRKGKAFKVYYATQTGTCPPTFALFCNDPDLAHFSYQRYLENRIRDELPLEGTPVRLDFRSSRDKAVGA